MYQFSGKLKIFAIALMVVGLIGTAYSFLSAPKTIEEAKEILENAHAHHGGGHADAHHDSKAADTHQKAQSHTTELEKKAKEVVEPSHLKETVAEHAAHSTDAHSKETVAEHNAHVLGEHAKETVAEHVKHAVDSTLAKVDESHLKETVAEHTGHVLGEHAKETVAEHTSHATDSHSKETVAEHLTHTKEVAHTNKVTEAHVDTTHDVAHATDTHGTAAHGDDHHAEHVFHQMQNRPVSAFYVAMLFFLGITLLVLAFYAAQRVAQAGWSVALFRVMEAITANIHYVSVFMLVFIILTAAHFTHIFPWMVEGTFNPLSDNYDPIVDGKKWWMTVTKWTVRGIVYLLGWNAFRFIIRKKSIEQDNGDLKLHKNLFNICVGFIVFFMITESMSVWDWIMGIDPHWFSTLFGWYVLATFLVCAVTVIALVAIYLRSKGFLPLVNDSHIHDLAKFMFGFSVFWTYLWFAQFMLIWYADMPEETTYYAQRFNEYKLPFLGMVVMNFVFPVLVLLNSDFKSLPWFVIIAGVVILVGHYVDLFVMIMPGTVGGQWGLGIGEISAFLFFLGLFIFATFRAFAKADPVPKGNPFLHESETHHYYNIEHRGESNTAHH